MKRNVILLMVLVSTVVVFIAATGSPDVLFSVSPDPLPIGTPAKLTLTNASDEFLTLTSKAPWSIYDDEGTVIFTPIYPTGEDIVDPGGTRDWTWNQDREDGKPLEPGLFEARMSFRAESGDTIVLETTFEVEAK